MRVAITVLALVSILICSCSTEAKDKNSKRDKDKSEVKFDPSNLIKLKNKKNKKLITMPTDSLWEYLVFTQGGCLTGGQYSLSAHTGMERCVMSSSKDWEVFFDREEKQIATFLLSKLADTTTTNIHTCPFANASAGEVAVYGLQKILAENWFDLDEFTAFQDRQSESQTENHQTWLQGILNNKEKREILMHHWQAKVESK